MESNFAHGSATAMTTNTAKTLDAKSSTPGASKSSALSQGHFALGSVTAF